MNNRRRSYEVAQVLGRKIEVDTEGLIHVFWGEGVNEVENVFSDIAPAIRQEKHVLESWIGIEEEIRGQVLVIPGEVDKVDALVKETMNIAREFLVPRLLTHQKREKLRRQIAGLIARIGAVRNAHKARFKRGLEFAHLQVTADSLFNVGQESDEWIAGDLYDTAGAGLARLEDIAKKVWGVGIRLQILLREEDRTKQVIKSTYTSLHRILVKLKTDGDLSTREIEKIASQICSGRNNLWNGLQSIWIPPYYSRVRSREVRQLTRVGDYAAAGDVDRIARAIESAWLKLRPVVKEEQDRWRPRARRWIAR